MRGLAVLLLLAGTLASARAETVYAPTFSFLIGGDENYVRSIALSGKDLVYGRNNRGYATIFDARTGAERTTLICPEPSDDFGDGALCGWSVAGSNRIIAATGWRHVDVFRHSGAFRRRIGVESGVQSIALHGSSLAVGTSYPTPRAQVFDADTGRLLRTLVLPEERTYERGVNVAYARGDIVLTAWSYGSTAEPGQVALFDGRTGVLRWHRRSPHASPSDGFGRALATLGKDVVAGPGAFRLEGETGRVVQTYPAGDLLAADGDTVAVVGATVQPNGDVYSAVRVHDADDGRLIDTLTLMPPETQGILGIALSGSYLAVVSDNYNGDGRVWMFSR